jgi:hypothetical protein
MTRFELRAWRDFIGPSINGPLPGSCLGGEPYPERRDCSIFRHRHGLDIQVGKPGQIVRRSRFTFNQPAAKRYRSPSLGSLTYP